MSFARLGIGMTIVLAALLVLTASARIGVGLPATVRAAPESPSACPAAPADLPNIVERTDFCVYYGDPTTLAQATTAADHIQDYWDRYASDFGFRAPLILSGKLEVRLTNSSDCNGGTWYPWNYLYVYTGCFDVPEDIQVVLGHELFHRVQYSYHGAEVKWFKEGTARAIQDNVFAAIDNWEDALSQSFSFNSEVNNYLISTNNDITSNPMRYKSALWWKYFSEQYGSTATEPERGADAFVELWEAAEFLDDVAALNQALAALGAGTSFNNAFRRFAVANWTKDLSSTPDGSYGYIDEDQTGNPAPYGPLVPEDLGTINISTSATRSNQSVSRYGARYYRAEVGTNCPVVSATFHKDSGADAFYHVVTQKDSALSTHVEGSATDWTQSFLNDGLSDIVVVLGARANSAQVDVTLSCADPVLDIKLPNSGAVAHVGPHDAPGKFLAQVLVTNGSPTGPVVAGLTNGDFQAQVNGVDAPVTGGGFVQEQYWLVIQAPDQAADDTYDLEIFLEEPGTTTVIASDTNADSVVYDIDNTDHVLVIDRSGSMGWGTDPRLPAAQAAANLYIDITRDGDGLAVVPYHNNVDPAPFALASADSTVRDDAKDYVDLLTAATTTSIGDGLNGAVTELGGSPTGNPRCSFVLLSDGMENTSLYWTDVMTPVVGTGCPVTSIAFGPESDETLMQDIATATGGPFFYNDVFVSAPPLALSAATADDAALELGGHYEYAQAQGERRQRLLSEKGVVPVRPEEQIHKVMVDETVSEVLFVLDWHQPGVEMVMRLRDPKGNIIEDATTPYTFMDTNSRHLGWRIRGPEIGQWEMLVTHQGGAQAPVPYQVLASGHSYLNLVLLLPDQIGSRFRTGNRVPIYAFLSAAGPIPDAAVEAFVTAPDGTETRVSLYDDGEHGDGAVRDGFYAGVYTRLNQAVAVMPQGEEVKDPPAPNDEGGYRVRAVALTDKFRREALGSFSVLEGDDVNQNGIPDPFDKEYQVENPQGDPDLDRLINFDEYRHGTNPRDSDTDDGGENDGSEVRNGQDPLDPADDRVGPPEFFRVTPVNGAVVLTYDVKRIYTSMQFYRATSSDGPWSPGDSLLPLTGVYSDTATNDTTYYYRLWGTFTENPDHDSAVLSSEGVTPSADPIPPESHILIDDGAPRTRALTATLSFTPYENENGNTESFDDITQMLISNDPTFAGAAWQPFAQDIPWRLAPSGLGTLAHVYARFVDDAANESVGAEVGTILYDPVVIFLPLVVRDH